MTPRPGDVVSLNVEFVAELQHGLALVRQLGRGNFSGAEGTICVLREHIVERHLTPSPSAETAPDPNHGPGSALA